MEETDKHLKMQAERYRRLARDVTTPDVLERMVTMAEAFEEAARQASAADDAP